MHKLNEVENMQQVIDFTDDYLIEDMRMKPYKTEPSALDQPHIDEETLAAFLEGLLTDDDAAKVKQHMRSCTACLLQMAALEKSIAARETIAFKKTPEAWVQQAVLRKPTPPAFIAFAKRLRIGATVGVGTFLVAKFRALKTWLSQHPIIRVQMAAVALATAVLLMLLWPRSAVKNNPLEQQMVIAQPGPLGFTGESEKQPYHGMSVRLDDSKSHLVLSWPPVRDAQFYEIYLIENGQKKMITPLGGIVETTFRVPKEAIQPGQEYRWELRGLLEDGRAFVARAAFRLDP